MDGPSFDALARLIGSGHSRRRLLKGLAGGALASTAAALGLSSAGAAKLRSAGNSCTTNGDCASGLCVQERPGRKICHCGSAGDCLNSDLCHPVVCSAGACLAGSASVCAASDSCHAAGTCNPSTGACSNPLAPNGTLCNDGGVCTNGVCGGVNLCAGVVCTPSDQCHVAGVCNPANGQCSNPPAPDGAGCDDGNACTQTDACQAGVCTGGNPVVCAAGDACHDAGVCDHATGACSNPAKPDGTGCSDDNACTQTDTCQAGVCTGGAPVECPASDQCHEAGVCDHDSGQCVSVPKADGTACAGVDQCFQTSTCQAGACTGSAPVLCAASDQCHLAGTCNPATGTCSNPGAADGTACDDGDPNSVGDVCTAGICSGVDRCAGVTCTPLNQCHLAGVCDPSTGSCSNPAAPDNTPCDDGDHNICTAGSCRNGACAPVDISRAMCDDGNACTTDSCDPVLGCTHRFPTPRATDNVCFQLECDPHGGAANWVAVPTRQCDECDFSEEHPECSPANVQAEIDHWCCPGRTCVPDFPGADTGHCGPRCGVADGCGTACGSYVLAGSFDIDESIYFNDDLVITVNGAAIFDSRPAASGYSTPPIGPFSASVGDVIAIEAINTYGGGYSLLAVQLFCANGSAAQWIAGGVQVDDNSLPPSTVPFLTASVAIDI